MTNLAQLDALISDQSLTETLSGMVDIASPTGEESALASYLSGKLDSYGIAADIQNLDETQANAFGKYGEQTDGKTLMLYAPIDTVTSNSEAEDVPWLAPELRNDMRAKARVKDGHIFGLGAHNPKGHGACILETARVLKDMDYTVGGNLFFGFGAGGMPTHHRDGLREGSGHGAGCAHMLANISKVDGAIIAKSGTSVTWEEVGFIWLEVTVEGVHNYVGARELMPYSNAIANAAKLVLKLEDWFEDYAAKHQSNFCRPQGTISWMESGWQRMPAFTPSAAKFLIDLRFSPDQNADEVEAEFADTLEKLCEDLDIKARFVRTQTIDASRTSQSDPVIQATTKAWEALQRRPHEPFTVMSGATDANILRQHGIPTARIGLAKADQPNIDFALGMNCVAISDLRHLTKLLILSVINYFERGR